MSSLAAMPVLSSQVRQGDTSVTDSSVKHKYFHNAQGLCNSRMFAGVVALRRIMTAFEADVNTV